MHNAERVLVIACGAIAHELVRVKKLNGWGFMDFQCLPAEWHNYPERIVPALREKIAAARGEYGRIFIGYGDCGTGGQLDAMLAEAEHRGIERLPGAHCYSFFAGGENFAAMHEAEVGTFYLTDYLARHFDRIIVTGLGIDRHPQLREEYFANYKKLIYLAQTDDHALDKLARGAAEFLGLEYQRLHTGDGHLQKAMEVRVNSPPVSA